MNKGAAFVVGLWLATAVLVGLFQCRLPAPWDILDAKKCINRVITLFPFPLFSLG